MRKIINIKLPQPDKSEDENSLFSLVLDEHGIILSIDKSSNRKSIYDEDLVWWLAKSKSDRSSYKWWFRDLIYRFNF